MAKSRNIKIHEITSNIDGPKSPLREKGKKKRSKKKVVIISSILFILIASIAAAYVFWPRHDEVSKVEEIREEEEKSPFDTESPLNGVMLTKDRSTWRPVGVMIENHPDARPQSGLTQADIVYECVTEGGITRYLALFLANDASEIGPVRSARVPFVNIAMEYNSFYAHVGGSAEALALIKKTKNFYDLNQFSLGNYFWRDNKRYAPHNVYTTFEKLQDAAESKKYDLVGNYNVWRFKDDSTAEDRGNTQSVTVDFSSSSYKVTYSYDKEKNVYLRFQAGKPHTDKVTGDQISAKTIIVQNVVSITNPDKTTNIKDIGTGKATVYMDGKVITGSWAKSGANRTKFYDENNTEIKFTRGQIWVELATNNVKNYSN